MFICLKCGEPNCSAEVGEFAHTEAKRKRDKDTRPWPSPNKLIKLDKVCRKYQRGLFTIDKRECIGCRSNHIESGFIRKFSYGPVKASQPIYPYRCATCGRMLFSYKES